MDGSRDNVIEVVDLVKTFGKFRALDGLSLSVAPGEVHGFLGPNGAGKSTTIRALLGMLRINGGTASVFGLNPRHDGVEIHRRLAYVPGDVALWPNLSGGEMVDLLLRLRGVTPDPTRMTALLADFEVDLKKKGRAYSKGNRQKVALVAALAAPVDLLILDEPTSGLDPLMEKVFGDYVKAAAAAGTTVLLSSHILSEVEHLADRVTIIRNGRTVETGTLADLRHLRLNRITAELSGPAPDLQIAGVRDVQVEGGRVSLAADASALTEVLTRLSAAGVQALTCTPPLLEEIFLDAYRERPKVDVP